MFNPQEAREDGYFVSAVISLLIAIGAYILLTVAFEKGLRYALALHDQIEVEGVVTQYLKDGGKLGYDVVRYQFDDTRGDRHEGEWLLHDAIDFRPGQPIDIFFNPLFPQYNSISDPIVAYTGDFWVFCIMIFIIIACFAFIIFQILGYIRFKKKMRYY